MRSVLAARGASASPRHRTIGTDRWPVRFLRKAQGGGAARGARSASRMGSKTAKRGRGGGAGCTKECPLGKALEVNPSYTPYANGCGLDGLPIDLSGGKYDFTPCCNVHDFCYQRCGATQKGCDKDFGVCLRELCEREYPGDGECKKLTNTYEQGVSMFGCSPFLQSQESACMCPELSEAEVEQYAAQLRAEAGPAATPSGEYCGSKNVLIVNIGLEASVDAAARTFSLKAWNEQDHSQFFGDEGCGPIPFAAATDAMVVSGFDPRAFKAAEPYPPCYEAFFGEEGFLSSVDISVRAERVGDDEAGRLVVEGRGACVCRRSVHALTRV